jgi:GT2 family glycosyltransferase
METSSETPAPVADKVAQQQPVAVQAPAGLVSIVITCCGQLEYTKLCVASVLRHSRRPYELIVLDIGSLDGTREFIAGVATAAQPRIEVVRTPSDLGIADAAAEAVKLARGDFLVLLNNDAVVTEGWLNQMVGLAQQNGPVGLVGPMSNYAPPMQLVDKVPYRIGPKKNARSDWLVDPAAIDGFARQWREKHRGQWESVDKLGGFCLLIKRDVLKRLGPLRETSELGLFDTDLLCASARKAGFTLARCSDLFIHHFGTRTFAQGAPKIDAEKPRN